jgi:hypothetical protein
MWSLIRKLFVKRDRHFVSSVDRFQTQWDATHPKTASQLAEIKKHDRVFSLRDTPQK